ncbi:MAG: class II aldolase/adducin family protein [Rhodoferax sp.]|nr:class II aldolase/adducin family protein [Rhodoferax sp.]
MLIYQTRIAVEVKSYCAQIGADPLLVQGAGGNASWKEGDVLWIKASGKCLSDAESEEIFIPVNLNHLRHEIRHKNFIANPLKKNVSRLKPSIETILHALMPQKIVFHLHAVEVLAHLVRKNLMGNFKKALLQNAKWGHIPYHKPGADLAKAVSEALLLMPNLEVIFLQNHGVIIGGENINSIRILLSKLLSLLGSQIPDLELTRMPHNNKTIINGYAFSSSKELNLLSTDKNIFRRLRVEWALYPDHVVFLGQYAFILDDLNDLHSLKIPEIKPPFIFIKNYGTLVSDETTESQKAQLLCYYNVLIRQPIDTDLVALTDEEIQALLNWDAEIYRKSIS